ncbi:hypothetical protein [Crossiella sp. CA198]|uniref:hypothetical protein n=1 Tax=Crossiella sp. CA198 TaxID=3455607 RepID=UPI003F8D1621
MSEARQLQRFDFEPAYAVEVEPEYPATGEWSCPVFAFDRDGRVIDEAEWGFGMPRVIRVTPTEAAEWVGLFPAGLPGRADGVFAGPGAGQLCVVVNGHALVVRVDEPAAGAVIVCEPVNQVVPVVGAALLLLVTYTDLVAIGSDGVAWESARLALDGLRVVAASGAGIRCTADSWQMDGSAESFVVAATGELGCRGGACTS